MEILSQSSYPNLFENKSYRTGWTPEENKRFENALAVYDKETPDRWQKIASMIPGKTVMDVLRQYKELEDDVSHIEAGLPIPGYSPSSFTLEWVNSPRAFSSPGGSKRPPSGRADQERKKGVPWTEEEHRLFLLGLKKYGKGDWRNISRNYVISRTPTQVASHAQKYFIRQHSGGKDKRRSSIHDITTVNCIEPTTLPDNNNRPHSENQSTFLGQSNMGFTPKPVFDWSQNSNGASMMFNQTNGNNNNFFAQSPYGIGSYGVKQHGQTMHRNGFHGSHV